MNVSRLICFATGHKLLNIFRVYHQVVSYRISCNNVFRKDNKISTRTQPLFHPLLFPSPPSLSKAELRASIRHQFLVSVQFLSQRGVGGQELIVSPTLTLSQFRCRVEIAVWSQVSVNWDIWLEPLPQGASDFLQSTGLSQTLTTAESGRYTCFPGPTGTSVWSILVTAWQFSRNVSAVNRPVSLFHSTDSSLGIIKQ